MISEGDTGPRQAALKFATNAPATSSPLPLGASYRSSGKQRYILITGDGVALDHWEFQIPRVVMAKDVAFTDCIGNAKGIVGKWKPLAIGYEQASGKVANGATVHLDHCTETFDGGPIDGGAVSGLVQVGMYLDPAKFTEGCKLTARNSQIRRGQAALVQAFGDLDIEDCFFGGFGGHPTDAAVHSEAIWAAYGDLSIRRSLFDHAETMNSRLLKTWTGWLYLNARYLELRYQIEGNVFRNPGPKSGPAIQLGIHTKTPGTLGLSSIHGNVIERFGANAHFAITNLPDPPFLYDNVDYSTGRPMSALAERRPVAAKPETIEITLKSGQTLVVKA